MKIVDELPYVNLVEKVDVKISLGGCFYGAIVADGVVEKNFAKALEYFDFVIEDLLLSGIGKFYIKKEEHKSTLLYSSVSDYGIYYYQSQKEFIIKRDAWCFGRPLNFDNVVRCVDSHHLIGRSHYGQELYKGVKRILPGTVCIITGDEIESYTYLIKRQKSEGRPMRKKRLTDLVEKVLGSYELTKDDCLLFSGGIDSAVLASLLRSLKVDISIINYRYENFMSDDALIVREFKKSILGQIKFYASNLMHISSVIDLMERDYGTILGPQYFKERRIGYKRLITGQNLDTLMHVDTFAPGSAYQGIIGLLMNSLSFNKRLRISQYAFDNRCYKFIFGIIGRKINGNELKIIDYLYSRLSEHTILTNDSFDEIRASPPSPYISNFLIKSWDYYRKDEVLNYYQLMKTSRFFKTCYNVNANYKPLKEGEFNERITPYTEGPVVHYLLGTKMPFIQLLLPKFLMYKIFSSKIGISYSRFTRSTSKSRVIPYLFHRLKRKNTKKFNKVDQQSEIDKMLTDLIDNLDLIIPEFQAIYDDFIYERSKFDKTKYLKLCRCLNMNYYVIAYGGYTDRGEI